MPHQIFARGRFAIMLQAKRQQALEVLLPQRDGHREVSLEPRVGRMGQGLAGGGLLDHIAMMRALLSDNL